MPDNNTLESQQGRFQRLESIDFARDTPGIIQSLKSKSRKLAISVHGNLNVHGLALRVEKGHLLDAADGLTLKAEVHVSSLDRGVVTTPLETRTTADGKGQWLIEKQDVVVQGALLGSHDLGSLTLRHKGSRTWEAHIQTSMLGLKQKVSGKLTFNKGKFESIALADTMNTPVAQTGLALECIRGEVRATKEGPSFHGHISLKGERERTVKNVGVSMPCRWDARIFVVHPGPISWVRVRSIPPLPLGNRRRSVATKTALEANSPRRPWHSPRPGPRSR